MNKKCAFAVACVSFLSCCWTVSPLHAADKNNKSAEVKSKQSSNKVLSADDKSKVTLVYEHELPNAPGKSIKGVLVEYAPGGSSPAHTHPKSAFIYATVLEGAINSKVNNGPVKTYSAGENFSEMPGDIHSVSENASKTKPARLLAVFVVDTNEKQLTTIHH
jgi:quercetin dioxygenase-like cupin family protein